MIKYGKKKSRKKLYAGGVLAAGSVAIWGIITVVSVGVATGMAYGFYKLGEAYWVEDE